MEISKFANFVLIVLFLLLLILHFLIVFKVVPYSLIWGGRLKTVKEMFWIEIFSILLNFIFLFFTLEWAGLTNLAMPLKTQKLSQWLILVFFLFSTVGNIFSKNRIERLVFAPLALFITIFLVIIVTNS